MMARRALIVAALLLASGSAAAQHSQHAAPKQCSDPTLACAAVATPAVGADGSLWLAWSAGGRVSVARSADGKTFGPAQSVSGPPATIDDNGEARPKVVLDRAGKVFVTWTARRAKGYEGDAFVSRSADGRSFAAPVKLSDNAASQRFETLIVAPDGKLGALWIDKRKGSGLAVAWSDDGGASFGPSRLLAERSCECCRLGVAALSDGTPVLTWRHVFDGGIRDHAAATLRPEGMGEIKRVAVDNWKVDGCPHHGPALTVEPSGAWQVAWYTDGAARQGLFHAFSTDGGRSFSAPREIGNPDNQPGHPQLLADKGVTWLAWKEFDGKQASIMAQSYNDGGRSWSSAHVVAATRGASDHPILVTFAGKPRLSWLTRNEGWRLLPLDGAP
jgi:hypothetical protein